jgi:hypothetical protein
LFSEFFIIPRLPNEMRDQSQVETLDSNEANRQPKNDAQRTFDNNFIALK